MVQSQDNRAEASLHNTALCILSANHDNAQKDKSAKGFSAKYSHDVPSNSAVPESEHAAQDGLCFRDFLGRCDFRGKVRIEGGETGQAEKDRVLQAIEECAITYKEKQPFLIYYSGHGRKDYGAWCLKGGYVTLDDVVHALRKAQFKGVCNLILDHCYAGQWVKQLEERHNKKMLTDLKICIHAFSGPEQTVDWGATRNNVLKCRTWTVWG